MHLSCSWSMGSMHHLRYIQDPAKIGKRQTRYMMCAAVDIASFFKADLRKRTKGGPRGGERGKWKAHDP